MRRRTALGALAAAALAACGGGGGGSSGAQGSAFGGGASIAAWGDSHTAGLPNRGDVPGYAALLRQIGGREVFIGGGAGLTSSQSADLQTQDDAHDGWVNVFWYGGNNQTQAATIQADLARSIASLAPGNERYLVLGVTNQASPWELRGTPDYDAIVQLNADLAATYGRHFVDVRSYLIGLADLGNPADAADVQNDVVPTSLRVDGVHLTAAGSTAVARRVLELIAANGW